MVGNATEGEQERARERSRHRFKVPARDGVTEKRISEQRPKGGGRHMIMEEQSRQGDASTEARAHLKVSEDAHGSQRGRS